MRIVMFLMMGSLACAQEFRLASVGSYGSFNGLLAPSGATERVSRGGAGMGFGPFPGIAGKARIALNKAANTLWTGHLSYDVFQGMGVAHSVM